MGVCAGCRRGVVHYTANQVLFETQRDTVTGVSTHDSVRRGWNS